ncbi:hypothetical protein PENARI_c013G05903 [Penicillium arizonense]|uniref:RNase III domain-containing protein n=1 Tax=Penicillium arizonense TaxID=1835702 RepID=A0A1F5LEA4_PENAI|nr:hypothetical protein PENARI_c013G05903 [Penicillium arizonense]OGE51532.1 hypothetical protein PENARI_c013G05903 [Penicillium arizonense]
MSDSDATQNLQKRPKVHRSARPFVTGLSIADDGSTAMKASTDSRLLLLQRLVRETLDNPDLTGADSEVMEALSSLDEKLRQTTNPFPNKGSTRTRQAPGGRHFEHDLTGIDGLSTPALPSVMDDKLRAAVFTHPALSNNNNTTYDRLEILGDAYIELIATKFVWERFPGLPSGRISQIREVLVKNETLSGFAETFGFDRKVAVPSNYNNPSKRWTKTKGDVFEAYVAAVILSDPVNGYQVAEHWLTSLWMPILKNLGPQKGGLRSKEALAKKIMGKNIKLEYLEERPSVQLKGGTQTFFIGLYLTGWGWEKRHLSSGQGLSKAAAGDEAAENALLNISLISEIVSAKESQESKM